MKEDTFVTYRRRKSRYTEEFEDIQLEDTNSDMDPTGIHSDRGERNKRRGRQVGILQLGKCIE